MQKRWVIKEQPDGGLAGRLGGELNNSPLIGSLLLQRSITSYQEAQEFFRPSLDNLHDPFLMKDMDKAVARLNLAIANGENILIYGDYDVDGTTAVSLVYSFLSNYYTKLGFYIPDRYSEGYGISFQGIDFAADNGISLIIALDCGIKAVDKISYAREKGIDFIICDHHRPGDVLPDAAAVLDPKRSDCSYPYDELSGCGVGFKLMQAYCRTNNIPEENLYGKLDLVAVSIAADIVPITGENRTLAYFGIRQINTAPSAGIATLLKSAGKALPVDISSLVFTIAPRINAAGRIDSGKQAVELLISQSESDASAFSDLLNTHNDSRKNIDKEITEHALEIIHSDEKLFRAKTTVLYHETWHKGVVGIVASRLIEKFYRPTILLTNANGKLTGSARSVKDFDVYEAIEACSEWLEQFGGHKYAAVLTMREENFEKFRDAFEEYVCKVIKEEMLVPTVEVDAELSFEELRAGNGLPRFFRVLKQFSPFGPGNMNPVFLTRKVRDFGNARTLKEEHLKMFLSQDSVPGVRIDAIGFGLGHHLQRIISGEPFDIAYSIEENEWNGNVKLQLVVKDIRFSEEN